MALLESIVLSSKKFMNAQKASDAALLTRPQKDPGRGRWGESRCRSPWATCVFLAHPATFRSQGFFSPSFQCLLLLLRRFSCARLCATPWTAAHQAPPSLGFSRQEHWSGVPLPFHFQCLLVDYLSPLLLFLSTDILADFFFFPLLFMTTKRQLNAREMKFMFTSFWYQFLGILPNLTIQNCTSVFLIGNLQRNPLCSYL